MLKILFSIKFKLSFKYCKLNPSIVFIINSFFPPFKLLKYEITKVSNKYDNTSSNIILSFCFSNISYIGFISFPKLKKHLILFSISLFPSSISGPIFLFKIILNKYPDFNTKTLSNEIYSIIFLL